MTKSIDPKPRQEQTSIWGCGWGPRNCRVAKKVEELSLLQSQAWWGIGRCRLYLMDPEELADSNSSLGSLGLIRGNVGQMWICQVERLPLPSAKQNLEQGGPR